ncbi:hypothetical protein VNI00_010076 [Paramarasmius palmivorus]|uniref:Peptidase M15C domain-containing protein n=1 Tax=Paramarasmius palmivorus TaxID=297713 RepID=A0AAW0CJP2_9AGAR
MKFGAIFALSILASVSAIPIRGRIRPQKPQQTSKTSSSGTFDKAATGIDVVGTIIEAGSAASQAGNAAPPPPPPPPSAPVNETLEARQGPLAVVEVVAQVAQFGIDFLTGLAADDDENRGRFTQETVARSLAEHPDYNVVIVHPKHTANWEGEQGVDWAHRHQEFDVKLGGTIGYEIYVAKAGEFVLEGDGGFINWAFGGNFVRDDKHLTFSAP